MNSAPPVQRIWFKRWGWLYRPIHPLGFVTLLAALAFVVQVFFAIDARSHSVTGTLYPFFVYAATTFLGLMWIASRTSVGNGGGQ